MGEDWCRQYLMERCIERNKPDYPLVAKGTGRPCGWYLLPRRALYNAAFALEAGRRLCNLIEKRLNGTSGWQLAGMESGAVPLLVVVAQEYHRRGRDVNVFTIRKEPKTYGTFNRFEGLPSKDLVTVLVDDTVHSGRSIGLCRELLGVEGFMVLEDVYCIIGSGPHVHALYTFEELGLKG